MTPFILRFRESMAAQIPLLFRYDPRRHVGQVWLEGQWQDVAAPGTRIRLATTLHTRIENETTDDE